MNMKSRNYSRRVLTIDRILDILEESMRDYSVKGDYRPRSILLLTNDLIREAEYVRRRKKNNRDV